MELLAKISASLMKLQEEKPLIHQITNYVTANDCANMTLAIGASPVMADAVSEAAEMASASAALVLNIGTLQPHTVESMLTAGKAANAKGIPVIFDPVGAGATRMRMQAANRIFQQIELAVVRGNMSEIKSLAGISTNSKGVDSVADSFCGEQIAREMARRLHCTIVISGKRDIVAGSEGQLCYIENGDEMLCRVTGTGCMSTALIASYCSVCNDSFVGAAAGMMTMGLAGEIARHSLTSGDGTGTFKIRLFDAVSRITTQCLRDNGKIVFAE